MLGGFQGMTAAMRADAEGDRGVPHRQGRRLARARPRALRRHRALLPARLQRQPGRRVDPGARRRARRSSRRARASPTSAAATAPRRSSWPRPSRARRSSASTTTRRRSSARASAPRRPASATACSFEVATAKTFPGSYDLVAFFDCLHDMGDPVGAAAHVRESLAPDGTWLLVEPLAGDHVEDNLNPVGRLFYSVSTLVCTPASLSQEVGTALGAQAGEARLREVLNQGRLHARPPRHRDAVQPRPRSPRVAEAPRPASGRSNSRGGARHAVPTLRSKRLPIDFAISTHAPC